MDGPGKYDELCTMCREQARAKGAVLIILGGDAGSGFSVQSTGAGLAQFIPKLLRSVADQIEEEQGRVEGAQSLSS